MLNNWLKKHSDDTGARLLLANIFMSLGRNADAIAEFEQLLPSANAALLNNLAWLYSQEGDPRALETARQAHSSEPDNPKVADTLGWILVANGNVNDAVELLKVSARELDTNPSVHYHLGIAYMQQGEEREARLALENAVDLGGQFPERREAEQALSLLERN